MSDTLVALLGGTAVHDFTNGSDYGVGAQKELETGVWGLWAADGTVDGFVTAPDFNIWNSATSSGATGYQQSDYNMDGFVTAPDFNLWNANTSAGAASGVPD